MFAKTVAFWAGLVLFSFSLLIFITSFQYEYVTGFGPGPGMLPLWLSAFMALLALIYLAQTIRHPASHQGMLPTKRAIYENGGILLYLILFICIVEYTGFTVASTMLLFLLFRGQFRWFVALCVAGGSSVFMFWLFAVILKLSLPVNIFGW
jgi:putative tricarboxylic transport membrane protein